MTASSRPSANRSATGVVVVCCAHDDAPTLQETVAALRGDGHEVELVAGLDADPKRLGEVIDRHEGEGLYVLCRSPSLGRERVEGLREILLARHIPFARTLTVAVGGRGALIDRIRSGQRRASAHGGGSGRGKGKGKGKGKDPASASPRLVSQRSSRPLDPTNATEDEEPTLVGKPDGSEQDESAAEPTGSAESVPSTEPAAPSSSIPLLPPVPSSPALRSSVVTESSTTEPFATRTSPSEGSFPEPISIEPELVTLEASSGKLVDPDPSGSVSNAALAMSELDLSDLDDSIKGPAPQPPDPLDTTEVGITPPLITGNTVVGPNPVLITGNTVVGVKLPDLQPKPGGMTWPHKDSHQALELEPTTQPFTRVTKDQDRNAPAPLPPRPPGPAAAPPAPGASADPSASALDPSASSSAPAGPSLSPALSPALGSPLGSPLATPAGSPAMPPLVTGEPAPPRSVLPLVLGGVALALLVLVLVLAFWSSQKPFDSIADQGAEAANRKAEQQAEAARKAAAEAEAARKASEPPPAPPSYPVIDALEARKVRALDVLLIATEWSEPGDFASAHRYCDQLDIGGLRGWRLPHVGELGSLSEANMIGRRGYFWSGTPADTFGDDHLAWNVRRGYAQPYEKDAVAVCVRGGVSGS